MRRLAAPALRLATLLAVALVVAPARAGAQSGDADGDGLPNAWEVQFGLDPLSAVGDDGAAGDPDGDGRSNLEELASGTHPRGTWSRSFAEGATGPLFDLRFALFNTHPTTSARVLMRFLTSEGAIVPHVLVLAPLARVTVDPETLPGLQATAISTVLEADTVVVVDRTMSWDATHYGSHAETGVAAPSQSWFLAEGATHSGFTLYYLLQNPGATTAAVTVTYLLPSGQPLERTYAVAPRSRFNILVNREDAALAATDVSASITSDVPIVVERAMYLDARGQHFGAGHASAGVTAPATQWLLAEGATGPFFDLFVLVANPGTQDAEIAAEFLLPDGTTVTHTRRVAARSRDTIWVDHVHPRLADTPVSTTITATNDVPVVVERAMWWPGGAWAEAHNAAGATAAAANWALAEGEVGGPEAAQTYVLVANTAAAAAIATVTLYFEDGGVASQAFDVAGRSRFTVDVAAHFAGEFSGGRHRRFATVVRGGGASPASFIVERAMYSNGGGVPWAAGTSALGTAIGESGSLPGDGGSRPSVSIAVTDFEAAESGIDRAVFTVTRSSGAGTLVVPLLFGGTASAADYGAPPPAVVFQPAATTALVVVTPNDDEAIEPLETVVVTLAAGAAYDLGQASAAIVIADNDPSSVPPASADDAVRFLEQASFGPTAGELARVRQIGFEAWIAEQVGAPQSGFLGYLDTAAGAGETISQNQLQEAWFQAATTGPDQLRQRVANALLEVLVVSSVGGLSGANHAVAAYMDLLMRHAFGNFRTLLQEVSTSPAMGEYLDHLRNQKEDPRTGRNPNENFARELLQLFSIGTARLNPDGTVVRDAEGVPVPTYGQDEVLGFAKVFTGWTFNQPDPKTNFWAPADWRNPMIAIGRYHSTSEKVLLDGAVIPAATVADPVGDLAVAIDNVFRHPNVGPYIGRQLIQRLVTSNPSPAYVARVAAAFDDNGQGVRGDLLAVVRAILLDPEARDAAHARSAYAGHVKEPMIRFVAVLRAFNGRATSGKFRVWSLQSDTAQAPFRSPSVFNFFSPDYGQPGAVAEAGLASPELQIASETAVIRTANVFRTLVYRGYGSAEHQIVLDFAEEQALAADPAALVDHLDRKLFGGALSRDVRAIVVDAVGGVAASRPLDRVRMAVYLLITSPEYVVQK